MGLEALMVHAQLLNLSTAVTWASTQVRPPTFKNRQALFGCYHRRLYSLSVCASRLDRSLTFWLWRWTLRVDERHILYIYLPSCVFLWKIFSLTFPREKKCKILFYYLRGRVLHVLTLGDAYIPKILEIPWNQWVHCNPQPLDIPPPTNFRGILPQIHGEMEEMSNFQTSNLTLPALSPFLEGCRFFKFV